jgi:MinD-like ATPase involved in chromosome partitioning or flagellar assembly
LRLRTGRGRERGEQAAAPATAGPRSAPLPAPPSPGGHHQEGIQPLLHPSLTRVAVAVRDLLLHQEVLDFVARDGRLDVACAVTDAGQLERSVAGGSVDAVVCCAQLANEIGELRWSGTSSRRRLFVVGQELTVPVLRNAIAVGAEGAFRWPEERRALGDQLRRRRPETPRVGSDRGTVVVVHGARGGAGTTFLACQLVAAFAARGASTALMDAGFAFSDVTAALGVPSNRDVRSVADLLPVVEEVSAEHLAKVLYRHPAGFGVLFGPFESAPIGAAEPGLVRASLTALRVEHDVVVVHTTRSLDAPALEALRHAHTVLLLTTLDLFSLYGAKRAVERLTASTSGGVDVVVNHAFRASAGVGDVERVLGLAPVARIRFDSRVGPAQQRGEVLPARSGRAARDVDRLAELVLSARPTPDAERD